MVNPFIVSTSFFLVSNRKLIYKLKATRCYHLVAYFVQCILWPIFRFVLGLSSLRVFPIARFSFFQLLCTTFTAFQIALSCCCFFLSHSFELVRLPSSMDFSHVPLGLRISNDCYHHRRPFLIPYCCQSDMPQWSLHHFRFHRNSLAFACCTHLCVFLASAFAQFPSLRASLMIPSLLRATSSCTLRPVNPSQACRCFIQTSKSLCRLLGTSLILFRISLTAFSSFPLQVRPFFVPSTFQ